MRVRPKEKPHKFKMMRKNFSQNSSLSTHMKVNTEIRVRQIFQKKLTKISPSNLKRILQDNQARVN